MTRRPVVLVVLLAALAVGLAWRVLTSDPDATRPGATAAVLNAPVSETRMAPALVVPPTSPTHEQPGSSPRAEPVTFSVKGHVLRVADSLSLPHATVELLGPRSADATEPVFASAVTADDGVFRLVSSTARPVALQCTWRAWRELLREGGATREPIPRAPVTQRVELPAAGPLPDDLIIRLDTGWTLSGQVRDGQGRPLEGAFVLVGKYGPEARTGTDGNYAVHDIEHTGAPRVDVGASAAFRKDQVVSVEPPADITKPVTLDFTLLPAGEVYGFVFMEAGFAVPDATVNAVVLGPVDSAEANDAVTATTDANGQYDLIGLPRGAFTLTCEWTQHKPGTDASQDVRRTAGAVDVKVDLDLATRQDFRLGAGVALSGRVLDASGRPVDSRHDVQLWTVTDTGPSARPMFLDGHVMLNDAGEFELTCLAPGPKQLKVIGPESGDVHLWNRIRLHFPAPDGPAKAAPSAEDALLDSLLRVELSRGLLLPPEGLRGLELTYASRHDAVGTVVDEHGRPIEGVKVEWISPERGMDSSVTGKDGRFHVRSASIEGLLILELSHPEYFTTVIQLAEGAGGDGPGQIVLSRAPALRVVVLDAESGEALPLASVIWHLSGGGRRDAVQRIAEVGAEPITLHADRSGGDWVLTVEAPEHLPWRRTSALLAGDDPESVTVRLQRE